MSNDFPRGRFVWYDLMTTDPNAAMTFYTDIANWGTQAWEGSAQPYTMWTREQQPIGGVMRLTPEMGPVPPHWIGYVAVPDVDATARQAESLGGRIMAPPMDIPTVGRFAVIADPQGAAIALFTPQGDAPGHEGAPNVGEVSWHELTTTDHVNAFDFYHQLFGWTRTGEHDMGDMGVYQMYGRGEQTLGGMWTKPADMPVPPNWMYYIRVANVDRTAERVKALGGIVMHGPMEVPGGDRVAQCMDPQGAAFAIHARAD